MPAARKIAAAHRTQGARHGKSVTGRRARVGADSAANRGADGSHPPVVVAARAAKQTRHGRVAGKSTRAPGSWNTRSSAGQLDAIAAAACSVRSMIEFVTDCGGKPIMLVAVIQLVDDQVAEMVAARDAIAKGMGIAPHACPATVCSSRWGRTKDAAGTDASGTERRRSRSK